VIGRVREGEVRRLVLESGWKDADCVFISCTNLRTFGVLQNLEEEIGIPVVSSNSATLWDMVRRVGLDGLKPGLGRLLTKI
jgi:maleate isomerase